MTDWADHLLIAPIILPLLAGAVLLLFDERRRNLKSVIGLGVTVLLTALAALLLVKAGVSSQAQVYRVGDWAAPFGIVLVADRLSAIMVLLTAILANATLLFALARWHSAGAHFHSLFLFLLAGLNGAFLTGDLFNLFVFFELLLAASYGLALHGSGIRRVRASLHYVAINLAASLVFLIGVSLIYSVTGTLNMADLAQRIPHLSATDRPLLEAGLALLGIVFLVKAGVWPLGFWLPPTYSAAAPPVAAMFSIMSKVGLYVILRLWLLLFGEGADAGFGAQWLLMAGLATIVFGTIGALAAQDMPRLASFSLLISSGTVLAVIATGESNATGPALFYLVSSTFGIAAFFMLIELIERGRDPAADILAVTRELYGDDDEDDPEEEVGVAFTATIAALGLCFVACTLVIAGMPPLSGFVAKFAILTALLNTSGAEPGVSLTAWILLAILIGSGLMILIAMVRAGIRTIWVPEDQSFPRIRLVEMTPIIILLLAAATMTVRAEPVMRYMQGAASALHSPEHYIRSVLPDASRFRVKGGGS